MGMKIMKNVRSWGLWKILISALIFKYRYFILFQKNWYKLIYVLFYLNEGNFSEIFNKISEQKKFGCSNWTEDVKNSNDDCRQLTSIV